MATVHPAAQAIGLEVSQRPFPVGLLCVVYAKGAEETGDMRECRALLAEAQQQVPVHCELERS
ncbi:MAG: hypothetical protein ABSC56_12260, partial [Solirubrobacteraceae bacterium]